MSVYNIGDLVSYEPAETLPASLGFIVEIKDEDLIRVHWYVEHILPQAKRHNEWLPASILEHAGGLKVLSRNNLTDEERFGKVVGEDG